MAGKRNSAKDQKMVQTIHDHAANLGADCGMSESRQAWVTMLRDGKVTGTQFADLLESLTDEQLLRYSDSADAKRDAVQLALKQRFFDPMRVNGYYGDGWYGYGPYILDLFDNDVVCSVDGELYAMPYTIDTENFVVLGDAVDVERAYVPERLPDDDAVAESLKVVSRGLLPLMERDITAADRAKLPSKNFAGKGSSFPIEKPEDIAAAVSSIGRAGDDNYSADKIQANIIKIAKRKGSMFVSQLPKTWKKSTQNESVTAPEPDGCELLTESVEIEKATIQFTPLSEAAVSDNGTMRLKVISPGWGSSGFYGADILERDGEAAFPASTRMFVNHQTEAEVAARPEGRVQDLAAVLVTPAKWDAKGPKGPGLYAEAKVFSDHASELNEKAGHIGVSIRAYGKTRLGKAEGREGKIVESLVAGKSVDFVTFAGAGGEILTESARPQGEEDQMTETEATALRESIAAGDTKLATANARIAQLLERELLRDASAHASTKLFVESVRLPDVTKKRLAIQLALNPPAKEDGSLDKTAFDTKITEAIVDATAYLGDLNATGQIRVPVGVEPVQEAANAETIDKILNKSFKGMGLSDQAAQLATNGRLG